MHPGENLDGRRLGGRDYYEDDERKGRESPGAWKECAHAEQHHALLPLPATALPSHTLHSIAYDRRRADLFPHEVKFSPPPFVGESRRRDHPLSYSTVFPANPFGQDRRHHFQHHTHFRAESPPMERRYSVAESEQSSTPPRGGKGSLAFILDDKEPEEKDQRMDVEPPLSRLHLHDSSSRDGYDDGDSSDTSLERYAHSGSERRSPPSVRDGSSGGRKSSVKKSRICKVENCTRYVVNKGLCIGHGGGKRCAVAGCTSSAKNMGVCWKHGGSTKCTVDNCENRAKSRGVCWSHGGGRKCKEDGCAKTAVSNGLCWAHGGGKRCVVEGCKKPAYERNGNLCTLHKGGTHAPSA